MMEKTGVCPGEGDEPIKTANDKLDGKSCGPDPLSKMADAVKEKIVGGIAQAKLRDANDQPEHPKEL